MKKYYLTRDIKAAGGHDEFVVEAENEEEARKLFEAGQCEIHQSHVDVTDYEDWEFELMFTED